MSYSTESHFQNGSSQLVRVKQSGQTRGWAWIEDGYQWWLFKTSYAGPPNTDARFEVVSTNGGGDFPGGAPSSRAAFLAAQNQGFTVRREYSIQLLTELPDDPDLPLHPGTVEFSGQGSGSGYGFGGTDGELWVSWNFDNPVTLDASANSPSHDTLEEFVAYVDNLMPPSSGNLLRIELRLRES